MIFDIRGFLKILILNFMLTFKNSNMSLPEDCNDNKINKVDNSELNTEAVCNIKATTSSQSDGNSILLDTHGTIPKVIKFSLNNHANDSRSELPDKNANDLVSTMEGLLLSPNSSEDNICKNDWLKARDSLENLLYPKHDKADVSNSKSTSCTTKEKHLIGESPHSESLIGATKTSCSSSVSKVLAWDPWDKLGRKNKKEAKRRKFEKNLKENNGAVSSQDKNRKDFKSGDEVRSNEATNNDSQTYLDNYEYQPYQPKNTRSVEFTNKVMVVYIKEDKVVGETTEPLKKELEQQIRNKEMRKGHMPDIPFAKKGCK